MPDGPPIEPSPLATAVPGPPAVSTRRAIIQVAIVLLVAVLPDLYAATASLFVDHSHRPPRAVWRMAVYIIARSLVVSAVVLGMMRWSPEPAAHFGLRRPRWQ